MAEKTSFKKFPIYFFLCWLPAFLLSFATIFGKSLKIPYLIVTPLGWVFAAVFLVGWSVLIFRLAVEHPRQTIGGIMVYLGLHIIGIAFFYTVIAKPLKIEYNVLSFLVGAFSFTPLDPLLQRLLQYSIPHELVVVIVILIFFIIFWLIGAIQGKRIRYRRGY